MKKQKITPEMQEVAADILTKFMFVSNMDEHTEMWGKIFAQYGLHDDPFTHTPCSDKEYAENQLEYSKQIMAERYGHCDGLE